MLSWWIGWLLFFSLKNFSLMWRRHYCLWKAGFFSARMGIPLSRNGYILIFSITGSIGLKCLIRRTACIVASYDKPGILRFSRMRGERSNNCFIMAATILSKPIGSFIIYIAKADPGPAHCLIYFTFWLHNTHVLSWKSTYIYFTLCSHNKD